MIIGLRKENIFQSFRIPIFHFVLC